MIIANPIYDTVFKNMMENERVAKFFIGTLLDKQIESVEIKPQEFTYKKELAGIALFRLDFIATIKTETGERIKILIEIQKARNELDLMRFRNYLGEQYKKEDKIGGENVVLPIITIYILGFVLPEIETACLKVKRNYEDLINNTIITKKSDFVEKLSHDCFVVQVNRVTNRYQTRLDKLLSVFEQNYFVDEHKTIKQFTHPTDNEDIKILTEVLHLSGIEPEGRKRIETELEVWRTLNAMSKGKDKMIETKNQELLETKKLLEEKNKEIENTKKTLEDKDKALEDMAKRLAELERKMK